LNLADETEPLSSNGSDQALLLAAVAHCVTDCGDAAAEGRFRYDASIPHRCDQVIFGDHVITIADEILQKIKHLRLDGHEVRVPPQFLPFNVK
jgi:hypothetical protein